MCWCPLLLINDRVAAAKRFRVPILNNSWVEEIMLKMVNWSFEREVLVVNNNLNPDIFVEGIRRSKHEDNDSCFSRLVCDAKPILFFNKADLFSHACRCHRFSEQEYFIICHNKYFD